MDINKILSYSPSADEKFVSITDFLLSAVLTCVVCFLLSKLYIHCAGSFSNRWRFAKTFVLLGLTTTLVITTIKSSLVLSLGLVGALSIVRFRAAIKDPEELIYLFLCIAVGLGFGAEQTTVTLTGFAVAVTVILLQYKRKSPDETEAFILYVSSAAPKEFNLERISETIANHSAKANLRRFDESESKSEAAFIIKPLTFRSLLNCKNELQQLPGSLQISFFDNRLEA